MEPETQGPGSVAGEQRIGLFRRSDAKAGNNFSRARIVRGRRGERLGQSRTIGEKHGAIWAVRFFGNRLRSRQREGGCCCEERRNGSREEKCGHEALQRFKACPGESYSVLRHDV